MYGTNMIFPPPPRTANEIRRCMHGAGISVVFYEMFCCQPYSSCVHRVLYRYTAQPLTCFEPRQDSACFLMMYDGYVITRRIRTLHFASLAWPGCVSYCDFNGSLLCKRTVHAVATGHVERICSYRLALPDLARFTACNHEVALYEIWELHSFDQRAGTYLHQTAIRTK